MLTIMLLIAVLAVFGPLQVFGALIAWAFFQLYPWQSIALLIIGIALYIAGRKFRNRINEKIRRLLK